MGVYKELQKHFGSSTGSYIIAARTTQGYEDWKLSTQEERLDVVARWHSIQIEIEKERNQARQNSNRPSHSFLRSRHLSFDERKKKAKNKKFWKNGQLETNKAGADSANASSSFPLHHAQTYPTSGIASSGNAEFEEAIQTSIAATSQGIPEQDKLIERAIRASVLELQSAAKEDDDGAMQRAIQASIDEAIRVRKENGLQGTLSETEDHENQLKDALHRSISIHESVNLEGTRQSLASYDLDDSGIDTEDDENMKLAIERSKSDT